MKKIILILCFILIALTTVASVCACDADNCTLKTDLNESNVDEVIVDENENNVDEVIVDEINKESNINGNDNNFQNDSSLGYKPSTILIDNCFINNTPDALDKIAKLHSSGYSNNISEIARQVGLAEPLVFDIIFRMIDGQFGETYRHRVIAPETLDEIAELYASGYSNLTEIAIKVGVSRQLMFDIIIRIIDGDFGVEYERKFLGMDPIEN